jgi:carotenoid cleavage dioxygenase
MAKRLDGGAFVFNPSANARMGVLPRHAENANDMQWFDVMPCAIFHVINSYETINSNQDTVVVLQACRFTTIDLSNMNSEEEDLKDYNEVWVWELNLTTGKVDREEPLLQSNQPTFSGDFPQINPNYVGRPQTYCWLSKFSPEHNTKFSSIVKMNCDDGTIVGEFEYGNMKRGGEIVFVSKENPTSEDDGYLIGFVHDEEHDVSSFWVIDAKSMDKTPICICEMPKRVPYGMHATFLTEKELIQSEMRHRGTISNLQRMERAKL